jgi:predicted DNA-binding antitoxin AbrB/MazE fold protein
MTFNDVPRGAAAVFDVARLLSLGRTIVSLEVKATYENGFLKPSQKLPLQEGETVTITIHLVRSAAKRFCGSLPWTRDPEELHRFLNDPDESSWSSRDV